MQFVDPTCSILRDKLVGPFFTRLSGMEVDIRIKQACQRMKKMECGKKEQIAIFYTPHISLEKSRFIILTF